MQENIHPSEFKITRQLRQEALGQKPALIWFTGLSGSGKSTLANATEQSLFQIGYHTYLLDGDNIRTGLCSDLSFSKEDRVENIRRIAEVAQLMMDAGLIVLSAFISPFRSDRDMIRDRVGSDRFLEIFVDCPLKVCEQRDVKGLYQKARQGLIKDFTGIDSPYEAPESPFKVIKTAEVPLEKGVTQLVEALDKKLK
ncbi:adenylyl-sulfate kinase [Cyclobacterium jeungdonense]|uniref:Adenylyl-sulfate kinase n=1 Tax=Cyclobacterium jeungdonense TaxID=708087 RepID=A0ABT8CCF2_9BACT|nr:adenylyl-sulfate kinase [Cyclobacterium jeungdonense]MDN3689493.1 adenylyl-sulfate kinase [Cyclobacterium jeungdonense]